MNKQNPQKRMQSPVRLNEGEKSAVLTNAKGSPTRAANGKNVVGTAAITRRSPSLFKPPLKQEGRRSKKQLRLRRRLETEFKRGISV